MTEPILEPGLPIVDPHHHLWDRPPALLRQMPPLEHGFMDILRSIPRYLLDEYLVDLQSGHNVRATVFIECGSMYRADGPEAFRRGRRDRVRERRRRDERQRRLRPTCGSAAGIVGHADLRLGAAVEDVLDAHLAAGRRTIPRHPPQRRLGRRPGGAGTAGKRLPRGSIVTRRSARGSGACTPLGLSFDAWLLPSADCPT